MGQLQAASEPVQSTTVEQTVLYQTTAKGVTSNPQEFGCTSSIAASLFHRLTNQMPFHLSQTNSTGR